MNTPLELTIAKPVRIRSWRDLLSAAEALHEDSTNHGYHGFRNSGRRYCANVKVRSWGDIDKSIDTLGPIPDEAEQAIRDQFSDNETSEIFNEWLQDSAEYLTDWFKGCAHSDSKYYDAQIAKVQAGEATSWPHIESIPTIAARIRELRKWQADDALFREAFRAADDGDEIAWEGRQGGYITWNPRFNIESAADDVIQACEYAINGNRDRDFRDVLIDFRDAERTHNLNLALINYLESWAKRMDFQEELDYRVQNFYSENEDQYTQAENIYESHKDVLVSFEDSYAAGNCQSGTATWAARHFPGRSEATVAEILAVDESRPLARRACRKAIHRHLAA